MANNDKLDQLQRLNDVLSDKQAREELTPRELKRNIEQFDVIWDDLALTLEAALSDDGIRPVIAATRSDRVKSEKLERNHDTAERYRTRYESLRNYTTALLSQSQCDQARLTSYGRQFIDACYYTARNYPHFIESSDFVAPQFRELFLQGDKTASAATFTERIDLIRDGRILSLLALRLDAAQVAQAEKDGRRKGQTVNDPIRTWFGQVETAKKQAEEWQKSLEKTNESIMSQLEAANTEEERDAVRERYKTKFHEERMKYSIFKKLTLRPLKDRMTTLEAHETPAGELPEG